MARVEQGEYGTCYIFIHSNLHTGERFSVKIVADGYRERGDIVIELL